MPKTLYPPANTTAQWFGDTYGGAVIEPNVTVWHTTETGGWPGYGGGASAPHLTYHALKHDWRQHFRLDRSARALRNEAGGVETNTLNACQVEIIAYSDEDLARSRGHLPVSDLDDQALRDLGEFTRFMWDEWGLRLDIDPGWLYSDFHAAPMSFSEWRNFYGHCGHNRVPENTHWDPARLDIRTIIAIANGEDDLSAEAERKIDQIHSWLSGNDQVARPYKSDDPKVSVRFGLGETWEDTHAIQAMVATLYQVLARSNGALVRHPHNDGQSSVRYGVERGWYNSWRSRLLGQQILALVEGMAEGLDTAAVLERIDQRASEVDAAIEALSDQLDDANSLLERLESGELDAAQVVEQWRQMLAERLAAGDSEGAA